MYHYYQKYKKSPSRFRFILYNNINFNYLIIVNIIYINRVPLLYIINKKHSFKLVNNYKILVLSIYGIYYKYIRLIYT